MGITDGHRESRSDAPVRPSVPAHQRGGKNQSQQWGPDQEVVEQDGTVNVWSVVKVKL
jgi:hypothetical protein